MGYDVIGDVHGNFDKLVGLLKRLGYHESMRAWRHPGRIAIFVGDLIDRGPQQIATVQLVRKMVDAGSAHCILGNHEFNAIAWHTPNITSPGQFLRSHSRDGNRNQHHAFLSEVEGRDIHNEIIDWFKTLPLWLEFPRFRVIHACWNDSYLDYLRPHLGSNQTLTDELIYYSNQEGHILFESVEAICKGLEVELPIGCSFLDKDGKQRNRTRIRWWQSDLTTYRSASLASNEILALIPDVAMPPDNRVTPYCGMPVFVGHYWQVGTPKVLSSNIACVDYSAGKGGPLVAYRWDGESELVSSNFIFVN